MTDESRIDEEYEPEDVDPDHPIDVLPEEVESPVEANPADWLDQHREVPVEDEEHEEPE